MVARSVRVGCHPNARLAASLEATSTAGSPSRRGATTVGIGCPVTDRHASITSRTENPVPEPRL